MFDGAVNFVRSNIPQALVEKATPYYAQAQDYATPYLEQAQSMKTKITDYAVNTSTTLKETSTSYVTGVAERLDHVIIDNSNKISSEYLGIEIINFHFKEALTKLAKRIEAKNKKDAKEESSTSTSSTSASASAPAAASESKEQAASSIASLFTTLSSSSTAVLNNVTSKISQIRTSTTDKVRSSKDCLISKAAASRGFAVKSVAGACSLALKGRDFAVAKQEQYAPERVSALAQKSVSAIQSFSAPYLQTIISQSKNLDSKYLQGVTFSFVNDVNTQLFPQGEEEMVAPTDADVTTASVSTTVVAAPTAVPVAQQQEQEQEDEDKEEIVVPAACTPKEQVEDVDSE